MPVHSHRRIELPGHISYRRMLALGLRRARCSPEFVPTGDRCWHRLGKLLAACQTLLAASAQTDTAARRQTARTLTVPPAGGEVVMSDFFRRLSGFSILLISRAKIGRRAGGVFRSGQSHSLGNLCCAWR